MQGNKLRLAVLHQQWVKCAQNIIGSQLMLHRHAERLAGVLVQYRQHVVVAPIAELVMNKADCPDGVWVCGS